MGIVTEDSIPGPTEPMDDEWDEERINSSLSLLQEMHIQLRELRQTIPSLMQIMHVEYPSTEALYTNISHTAMKSIACIQSFTTLVKSPRSQEVLVRAKGSRTKNEEGITGWLVTHHPDWLDRAVEDGVKELKLDEDQKNDETRTTLSLEDATSILHNFQDEHPLVEVLVDKESNSIKLYLPPPTRIHFHIQLQPGSRSNKTYAVTCAESSHLHVGILGSIAKRPRSNDLKYLLVLQNSQRHNILH
ncbi:hypothetical protein MMC26_000619 [Xylographa opegraphella]|nr:hypothetical protein [Xylographa opegraphella]